jgi:hypothetical protein
VTDITFDEERHTFLGVKVPRQFPLVLLVS